MAQIRDVARTAGVSVGTVSRVINNASNVSPELRTRVLRAVEELRYRPHALAQGLRRRQSRTLGLVVPDITNPFFAQLAREVERAATTAGYSVFLVNSDNDSSEESLHIQTLVDRRVDGLILVPTTRTSRVIPTLEIPVVLVDRELPRTEVISCDHEGGVRSATNHLADLGHRLIAFISGPSGLSVTDRRLRGYRSVATRLLENAGIDPSTFIVAAAFSYEGGRGAMKELLEQEGRPTAVVCSSDQQAIGALRACVDLGVSVPDDISVVGFDDISLASLVTPRLTTVAQPLGEIGRAAVARLVAVGPGGRSDGRIRRTLLPTHLVIRESSGPPTTAAGRPLRR